MVDVSFPAPYKPFVSIILVYVTVILSNCTDYCAYLPADTLENTIEMYLEGPFF